VQEATAVFALLLRSLQEFVSEDSNDNKREIQQLNEVQTEAMDADSEYRENSDSSFVWDENSQLYFHARFSFPPNFENTHR